MLRMFQSQTSAQAKDYFRDALSKADYYLEDQELNGTFNGKIAKRLGLEDQFIDKTTFEKLCDNINPKEGGSLTPRTDVNRRVGYDISFHCPKSVSILHALGQDKRVLKVFEESIYETMLDIEKDMQTRIRVQKQYDDRDTGELLWTNFVHQTARPVDGFPPDPHLHCHCFTFNVTYDEVENRYKAGQFHNIKQDMPYHQARFHKRLADKLSGLGYGIRKTNNGFELAVIPQKAIDFFSKRTNLIGQVAKEKGITNPKELDQLGAKTRAKKQKNLTMPELKEKWHSQLDKAGIDGKTKEEIKTIDKSHSPDSAIDHAINHVFTRSSVKRDRQILTEGYKHIVDNHHVTLDQIDRSLEENERVFKIQVGNQRLCTTELVHAEERKMINLAREGVGKHRPFNLNFDKLKFDQLGEQQQIVMHHVMTSQDRLMMFRGVAGAGKTTMLKELVPEIEKTGKHVFLFAPTAEASRDVLRQEGFENANTVARLLSDKKLQEKIKGQVILIDEAGMLGVQDMSAILDLAQKKQARIILSGDPRQHTAVLRGDAMRLLQTIGKIPIASLETIYRQKNATYKEAVKEISQGNIKSGFAILKKQGSIKELNPKDISKQLVDDYLKARKNKKSAIVVTPTRANVDQINQDVRDGLRETKHIGKREKSFTTYKNHYLTETQKQDVRVYRKGMIIQTYQNLPSKNGGLKKGSVNKVVDIKDKRIIVRDVEGTDHILPTHKAKDYDLYSQEEIKLSKGDDIRIVNKNGFDKQGKRLDSRTVLTIQGFTKEGDIKAVRQSSHRRSEFILPKDHGNFEHAYAITSYSSQAKTVDQVIISQPATTFPASNQKQFYVSVSRGRENVTIYTDDAEDLLKQIEKSGDRQGATELKNTDFISVKTIEPDKEIAKPTKHIEIDYEPEL